MESIQVIQVVMIWSHLYWRRRRRWEGEKETTLPLIWYLVEERYNREKSAKIILLVQIRNVEIQCKILLKWKNVNQMLQQTGIKNEGLVK